jgi:hypothetical protein
MKEHSGIEHLAQMRYISGLFTVNQSIIFINTIDYAKKFMKLQVSEEDLREGNRDITPNILFTRKIPLLMFECSKKLAKKLRIYSAFPLMGFNYYTTEGNNTIEISQNHITKNERRSWIYISEKLLDKTNMILANTIEVVPVWKKKKKFYFMVAFIFRECFGPAPVTIDIAVYEMDGATEVIYHNYLVEKEGLQNSLL